MRGPRRILILGASYGALFGTKLAAAGHHVTLVGLPNEVARINDDGCRVRLHGRRDEAGRQAALTAALREGGIGASLTYDRVLLLDQMKAG